MKKILLFSLLICFSPGIRAQDSNLTARMDSLMSANYHADEPGATVLVKKGDQVLLRKAYGMADMELGVPLKPENVFRLGSITKQFTAAAILMLREEGKVKLDEPLTTYLTDYPAETGGKVTVRHLLNHTSGIPSYTGMPDFSTYIREDLNLDGLIAKFKDLPLEFEPGTEWSYNNSGYILLGAIIEAASGKTYEEYIEEEIFAPLGMENSYYGNVSDIIPGRVEGYKRSGEEIQVAGYLSMNLPHAAGSLLSNVDDLTTWNEALKGESLLPRAALEESWTPAKLSDGTDTGYGYGWLLGESGGKRVIEHGGGINGFRTIISRVPDEDLLVVILQNREWSSPPSLAVQLTDMVLGKDSPEPYKVKGRKLKDYTGNYRITDEAFRVVTLRNDTLVSQRTRQPEFVLVPVGKDEFYSPGDSDGRFVFVRNKKGEVTELVFRPRTGMHSRSYRTDDPAPAEPEVVEIKKGAMERYTGTYELAPNFALTVFMEDESMKIQGTGQPAVEVFPKSDNRFFAKVVNAEIEFIEEDGEVVSLILYQNGQEVPGKKIE
ncbi:MAG: serine hydrolase [Cyclobacteriaceae bacterium]